MSKLITAAAYAAKLGVTPRRVRALCQQGRIKGAQQIGTDWLIPSNAVPTDGKRGPKGGWET